MSNLYLEMVRATRGTSFVPMSTFWAVNQLYIIGNTISKYALVIGWRIEDDFCS